MTDPAKPSMLQLPNGTFLYPLRFRSVDAFRKGTPPDVQVVLKCLTIEDKIEVENIHCETYEEAHAVGRVLGRAMAKHFPGVTVTFREGDE